MADSQHIVLTTIATILVDYPEGDGNIFLQNVGTHPPNYSLKTVILILTPMRTSDLTNVALVLSTLRFQYATI
jgi:hypothetical protein